MTSQPGFVSSASDGSTFNSADCDSGAQDMFGDSLTLNELRKTYPELYRFMHQTDQNCENTGDSPGLNEVQTWNQNNENHAKSPEISNTNAKNLFVAGDSGTSLLTIRKAMSSIFECLNAVHVQKTSKLRLEIRDLCCRLQNLQTSREMDQSEIYRLQRENDRYRRELSQQAARYEDRMTELHGVLAELRRQTTDMQSSSLTATVNGTRTGVDELMEVSDHELEEEEYSDVRRDPFASSDYTPQQSSSDSPFNGEVHNLGRQEAWISASVRTVNSAQSDPTTQLLLDGGAKDVPLQGHQTSVSNSGIKPVMGLRHHNQTRKTRILSHAASSSSSPANWLQQQQRHFSTANEAPSNHQQKQVSQPASELSLNFDGAGVGKELGLCKSPSCDGHIRKSVSSILSSSTSSVPQSCRSNVGGGGGEGGCDNNDSEASGQDEPQWVRHCLSNCQNAEQQQQPGRSTCWRLADASMAQRLLGCLACSAPHARLADAAKCALLDCEQRDAACSHRDAEVCVLKASLAEAKAAGDQLLFRLQQMEASTCAAARAADLADMALEANGVLVHLYSSELAILLHKQPHRDRRVRRCSRQGSHQKHQSRCNQTERLFNQVSLSGSTTSSSSSSSSSNSSCSSDEDDLHRPTKPTNQATTTGAGQQQASRPPLPPSTQRSSNSGSNVYAVYSVNGEPIPSWILPHAMCDGPACLRLLRIQRQQTEVAALRLLFRFLSTPEPFVKAEIIPPDDFESLPLHTTQNANFAASGRCQPASAHITATNTESGLGGESGGSSSGMGSHGLYANSWYVVNNSINNSNNNGSFNAVRPQGQPIAMAQGGWQTPDSGAGSCTMVVGNDAAHHQLVAMHPGGNKLHANTTFSSASSSSVASASSLATGAVADSEGWNRVKELKLRRIIDKILWERTLVRNTVAVVCSDGLGTRGHSHNSGDFQYMRPYAYSEKLAYTDSDMAQSVGTQDSREPVISNRLDALMLVDTAILIEDLCAVKEDRAKLKVQNYIMEKELRAIQLSLQGHCLAESTLRSQLSTLQIDRNLQLPQTPERQPGAYSSSIAQQIESLQSAFEALRKGVEQHQSKSEDLVNDLKQANAALITAFEKAKSKYLSRIRKLEGRNQTPLAPASTGKTSSCTNTQRPTPPLVPPHKSTLHQAQPPQRPPAPVSPQSNSGVYEVIQDSQQPPGALHNTCTPHANPLPAQVHPNGYSIIRNNTPFYPKHPGGPLYNTNRAPPSRPR